MLYTLKGNDELELEMNPTFRELHNKVTKSKSTDYTSKTSVNGFIEIIADSVRKLICSQIKDAGMFSTLIDESRHSKTRSLPWLLDTMLVK